MYKSPIEIVEDIQEKVTMSMENNVVRAVQAVGINIDKHELVAALMQDKTRYEAAYEQGKRDAEKHGRWIQDHFPSTSGGEYEVWLCSECQSAFNWRMRYCGHCGARMRGEDDE